MKHQREVLGMTQEQLAVKLNVKQSTIAGWEGGRREPETLKMFEDLARALKCQPAYLLYNISKESEPDFGWSEEERRAASAFIEMLRGQKAS